MENERNRTGAWLAGACLTGVAVALGAFGAHGLEGRVEPRFLDVWETAVRYHLVHGAGLLAIGAARGRLAGAPLSVATYAFVIGIVLFAGSLYTMVATGNRALGIVTPFGGVAFLAGWIAFAVAAWRGAPAARA